MIINLLLAITLIALSIGLMVSIDTTTSLMTNAVKKVLRWTRNSKLLTEYVLRAYLRYRKTINKSIINNAY